jgi:hypothetical protein
VKEIKNCQIDRKNEEEIVTSPQKGKNVDGKNYTRYIIPGRRGLSKVSFVVSKNVLNM